MRHSGKARKAGFKILLLTLVLVLLVPLGGALVTCLGLTMLALFGFLIPAWMVFALFTLYFFRDPNPRVPAEANLVVSPGHGRVDVVDTITEPRFMGGECRRISMFLSLFDVHVQNAPLAGRVSCFKYTEGQFLNAMRPECVAVNENVLIGIEAAEPRGTKAGVRLIAGVLARRIVSWVSQGDEVARGDRIGLIQFGSRVELYLPLSAKIKTKVGDQVVGGETVLAVFE
jgi:phosphatidylserine decarboxylase